jgi:predicted RNA binding protein YcfA (HicA-like mRNA interferase family)
MTSAEAIRRITDAGWYEVARRGSHAQFKHDTRPGRVTVPHPRRDIPIGTLRSIEKQSGVSMR